MVDIEAIRNTLKNDRVDRMVRIRKVIEKELKLDKPNYKKIGKKVSKILGYNKEIQRK